MSASVGGNHGSHQNRYSPVGVKFGTVETIRSLETRISTSPSKMNGSSSDDKSLEFLQLDESERYPNSRSEGRDAPDDNSTRYIVNEEELTYPALEEREASAKNGLSWRSDPNASFSDWTIEVASEGDGPSVSYHCHSNVLVWGPRKSDTFMNLFQERMRQFPPSNVTQLVLPTDEAAVFPILLDFIYCETTLPMSAGRVCSMYLLADRFENEMMMTAIQNFVENSLTFQQSIEFLAYARRHERKDKIERLVLFVNSKICGYLVQCPTEASRVPPELLAHMLHRRAQVIKVLKGEDPRKFSGEWEYERSRQLSMVVAECCYKCISRKSKKYVLSPHTFRKLVDPKHLPALDSIASLRLLQVDSALGDYEDEGQGLEMSAEKKSTLKKEKRPLSSLETRCIQSLVLDWRQLFGESNHKTLAIALAQINSNVLSKVLVLVSSQYENLNIQTKTGHERR